MSERPERGDYLIEGGVVVTADTGKGVLDSGQVRVHEGEIVDVGTDLTADDGVERIDASGMIVMPGLIESHFHMWSSVGRNFISEGYEYFPAKWATSEHYTPDDFYNSVLLGSVEALNAGITTIHNWSHNTRTPDHADAELRAHGDSMVRARYSYGHPDMLPEDEALDFTDIDRVVSEWFGGDPPLEGLVHLGVNLRGPDLGDLDVFYGEMADIQARSLPVSIHTMQGGSTKVDATELEKHGFLGPDFLICHFLAARDVDMQAMAGNGTPLSYSVHSELRLGEAGDPRSALLRFRDSGVTVSLSIDATSISPVNLFECMNVTWNMGIPWEGSATADFEPVTFRQCIEMATINGAKTLGLDSLLGSLIPGKRADLIMIRGTDLNVAPVVDAESTVVRSVTPANVDSVMVDGRFLKRDGKLTAHDAAEIVARAEESALAVRKRAGGRLAP